MIDVHIHVTNARLPGIKAEHPALNGPPQPLAEYLLGELKTSGVEQALAMGNLEAPATDPLGINGILRLASLVPGLHAIGAIDPSKNSADDLRRVEDALASGKAKALKAYLGYLPIGPDAPEYLPYYKLAAKYKIPVVFHTGDTYSTTARVRFAHPLRVDDVAVDHPEVRFVLAHFGNPWLVDAAEVLYKNDNVWADLSGLIVGEKALFDAHFGAIKPVQAIDDAILDVRKAYQYVGKPDRFLYGSDWPLAPMPSYRKLIEAIIPKADREAVFTQNARALFGLGDPEKPR